MRAIGGKWANLSRRAPAAKAQKLYAQGCTPQIYHRPIKFANQLFKLCSLIFSRKARKR